METLIETIGNEVSKLNGKCTSDDIAQIIAVRLAPYYFQMSAPERDSIRDFIVGYGIAGVTAEWVEEVCEAYRPRVFSEEVRTRIEELKKSVIKFDGYTIAQYANGDEMPSAYWYTGDMSLRDDYAFHSLLTPDLCARAWNKSDHGWDYERYLKIEIDAVLAKRQAVADEIQRKISVKAQTLKIDTSPLAGVVEFLRCGAMAEMPANLARLVELNTRGMKVPFNKFAELSTIVTWGGLLARRYKTRDGLSSALMALLVASMASGKGEAFRFWIKQIARLYSAGSLPHVFTGSSSSAQELHHEIEKLGTTIWVREDAAGDIQMLATPNGDIQTKFRDYVYQLFDASTYGAPPVCPVASVAGNKRGDEPIKNAACAFLWSTTKEAFQAVYNDAVLSTGLGSRQLVNVHEGPAGKAQRDEDVLRELPKWADELLMKFLTLANEMDQAYAVEQAYFERLSENIKAGKVLAENKPNPDVLVQFVDYTYEASELLWELDCATSEIRHKVDRKELKFHYGVFARTPMLTKKLALGAALIRNVDNPVIIRDDVAWGLGYALGCFGSVAALFEVGEVGDPNDRLRLEWLIKLSKNFTKEKQHHPRLTDNMFNNMVIPHWLFILKMKRATRAFTERNIGSDKLLERALATACNMGMYEHLPAPNEYSKKSICYKVCDLSLLDDY